MKDELQATLDAAGSGDDIFALGRTVLAFASNLDGKKDFSHGKTMVTTLASYGAELRLFQKDLTKATEKAEAKRPNRCTQQTASRHS